MENEISKNIIYKNIKYMKIIKLTENESKKTSTVKT